MAEKSAIFTFMMFWTAFFIFLGYMTALSGYEIFKNNEIFEDLANKEISGWDFINPVFIFQILGGLVSISSDYALVVGLITGPFVTVMFIAILMLIRG